MNFISFYSKLVRLKVEENVLLNEYIEYVFLFQTGSIKR